jgi:hypothetical protein
MERVDFADTGPLSLPFHELSARIFMGTAIGFRTDQFGSAGVQLMVYCGHDT